MQQLPSYTSKSLIFLALPRTQECQSRVVDKLAIMSKQSTHTQWIIDEEIELK